jgi:hypothetical protein
MDIFGKRKISELELALKKATKKETNISCYPTHITIQSINSTMILKN